MKSIILLFLIHSVLFSKVYYSKVDPFEVRYISANVPGLITFIDEDMIGKKLFSKAYLLIDSELDEKELKTIKTKILYLKNTLTINEKILENLQNALFKKRGNYKRVENLKIKSKIEKNREFYDLITSENNYLNITKEMFTLKNQIADLELRKTQLKRGIKDKKIINKGFILYSIDVKVGQVVNVSTPLAKIADTSKAKLTLFLDEKDALKAQEKIIFLNNKKTNYKLTRVSNISDATNISKYKAHIIIKSPKLFSKLIKIELKENDSVK